MLRYIERNPLRAGLVTRAEDWPWSSLPRWSQAEPFALLHPGPVPRPQDWLNYVNAVVHETELRRLWHSVRHGTPYGSAEWTKTTAAQLGLESTLRPPGRPANQSAPSADNTTCPGLFS